MVQSDCLVLIEAMQQNATNSMVAPPILDNCWLLIFYFGKVVLENFIHDANSVAHVLAQNSRVDPPNV